MGVSSTNAKQSNSTQVDAGNVTADYPHGGGVDPTLKTTNTGKTGIPSVENVDPTKALNYFQTAGNNYQTNALQGLQYYQGQIQNAISAVQQGYQTANSRLEPISYNGTTAGNQFMKMLGLDAPSPTRGLAQQVGGLGGQYTDVAAQMRAAESIQDPTQRTAAMNAINASLSSLNSSQLSTYQQQQAAEIAALGARPTGMSVLGQMMSNGDPLANQLAYFGDPNNPQTKGNLSGLGNLPSVQAVGTAQKNYDDQVAAINAKYAGQAQQFQASAGGLAQQFAQNYAPNANYFGYTGGGQPLNATGGMTPTGMPLSSSQAAYNATHPSIIGGGGLEGSSLISGASPQILGALGNAVAGFSSAFNRLNSTDTQPIDHNYLMNNVDGYDLAYNRLHGLDTTLLNNDTLKNTPGYQFSYDQGNQAVLAAAAAGGMLSSGNTLTAADKYSQGLAQQIYQYEANLQQQRYITDQQAVTTDLTSQQQIQEQKYKDDQAILQGGQNMYMDNLFKQTALGANATGQMAQNDANSGVQTGNLYQANATAGLNTYTGIGSKLFDASTNQGNTLNQDSLSNMSAQNQMIMAMVTKGGGSAGQLASLGGLANSMNNQQQMANGFNNAISGGSSLFGGGGGGGVDAWNSIGPIGGDVGSGGNGSPSF